MGMLDRLRHRRAVIRPQWTDPGWRAVPPITPVLRRPDPRIGPGLPFHHNLASWQDITFGTPLGHSVGPSAPVGTMHGIIRYRAPAAALTPDGHPLPLLRSAGTAPPGEPIVAGTPAGPTTPPTRPGPPRRAAPAPEAPAIPARPGAATAVRPRAVGRPLIVARRVATLPVRTLPSVPSTMEHARPPVRSAAMPAPRPEPPTPDAAPAPASTASHGIRPLIAERPVPPSAGPDRPTPVQRLPQASPRNRPPGIGEPLVSIPATAVLPSGAPASTAQPPGAIPVAVPRFALPPPAAPPPAGTPPAPAPPPAGPPFAAPPPAVLPSAPRSGTPPVPVPPSAVLPLAAPPAGAPDSGSPPAGGSSTVPPIRPQRATGLPSGAPPVDSRSVSEAPPDRLSPDRSSPARPVTVSRSPSGAPPAERPAAGPAGPSPAEPDSPSVPGAPPAGSPPVGPRSRVRPAVPPAETRSILGSPPAGLPVVMPATAPSAEPAATTGVPSAGAPAGRPSLVPAEIPSAGPPRTGLPPAIPADAPSAMPDAKPRPASGPTASATADLFVAQRFGGESRPKPLAAAGTGRRPAEPAYRTRPLLASRQLIAPGAESTATGQRVTRAVWRPAAASTRPAVRPVEAPLARPDGAGTAEIIAMAPKPVALQRTSVQPAQAPMPVAAGRRPPQTVTAPAVPAGLLPPAVLSQPKAATTVIARTPATTPPATQESRVDSVAGVELDALARRLLEPVSRLLRADLRQGRERAGRGHDRRR
jgi:hypothetical protein